MQDRVVKVRGLRGQGLGKVPVILFLAALIGGAVYFVLQQIGS